MGLRFESESIAKLSARLPEALATVVDFTGLDPEEAERLGEPYWRKTCAWDRLPGHHRRHVFDFADGFRLIISRDNWGTGPLVHISGSCSGHPELWADKIHSQDDFVRELRRHYALIGGEVQGRVFVCRFSRMVGHLFDVTERFAAMWAHP